MGEKLDFFNSNAFDRSCEKLKSALLDDKKSSALFKQAKEVFDSSTLDKTKRQYKSETETEMVIQAYRVFKSKELSETVV